MIVESLLFNCWLSFLVCLCGWLLLLLPFFVLLSLLRLLVTASVAVGRCGFCCCYCCRCRWCCSCSGVRTYYRCCCLWLFIYCSSHFCDVHHTCYVVLCSVAVCGVVRFVSCWLLCRNGPTVLQVQQLTDGLTGKGVFAGCGVVGPVMPSPTKRLSFT